MASFNWFKMVLWSIGEHLLVPLLGALTISILVGSIAFLLVKARAKREMKLQKLKAQVNELKEQLRSTQAMATSLAIELSGSGPFQLPLLIHLNWLVPTDEDRIVAEFVSENGKRIYVTISYRAVAQFLNDHRAGPLQKEALPPAASIDFEKPADAYELPRLTRLEGHFDRGRNLRIIIFSSEDGRNLLFPLSFSTYEELLVQSRAAMASYQEEKWLHEIMSRHPISPLLSGR